MSDSTTFEFETAIEISEITETILFLWNRCDYEVRVYRRPEAPGKTFCTLDHLSSAPADRPLLTSVLQYIHSISSDGKVYCYRCADLVGTMRNRSTHVPVLEVSVTDLLAADFASPVAASVATKYLISSHSFLGH